MADAAPAGEPGGFRGGFGSRGGDRGCGGPRGAGRGRGRGKEDQKEWVPVTKLIREHLPVLTAHRRDHRFLPRPLSTMRSRLLPVTYAFQGVKCSKEVATAIRGAIILAKFSVRRGYWGNKIGKPHTVPCKVTRKCGSITVRMIPAPRGTGIVSAPVPKKLLQMAGVWIWWSATLQLVAPLAPLATLLRLLMQLLPRPMPILLLTCGGTFH